MKRGTTQKKGLASQKTILANNLAKSKPAGKNNMATIGSTIESDGGLSTDEDIANQKLDNLDSEAELEVADQSMPTGVAGAAAAATKRKGKPVRPNANKKQTRFKEDEEEKKEPDLSQSKKGAGIQFTTNEDAIFNKVEPIKLSNCKGPAAKREDYDPKTSKSSVEISNEVVLRVLKSFVVLGEKILDRPTIE